MAQLYVWESVWDHDGSYRVIIRIYRAINSDENLWFAMALQGHRILLLFSRSELLNESEARSAESRSDVAPNARRRAQADANLGQGLFIFKQ